MYTELVGGTYTEKKVSGEIIQWIVVMTCFLLLNSSL